MSEKVDALFSGLGTEVPSQATRPVSRTQRLLAIAIVLNILGLPCWTSVPGAVLTLWVWMSLDTEMARVEAGAYSEADTAALLSLRRYASLTLVLCVVCLVVQIALLSTTFYTRFWGGISVALNHLFQGG
jgi:hypothetical protein